LIAFSTLLLFAASFKILAGHGQIQLMNHLREIVAACTFLGKAAFARGYRARLPFAVVIAKFADRMTGFAVVRPTSEIGFNKSTLPPSGPI
jgi:hypothetical protein